MRVAMLAGASSLLILTGTASAQGTQQPTDPEADSPSGVVYELPFDRARDDAAPRRRERGDRRRTSPRRDDGRNGEPGDGGGDTGDGPSGGGGPAPGRDPTSIRSENNFGSSSQVPGVDDGAASEPRRGGEDGERRDGQTGDRASADDRDLGEGSGGTDGGGVVAPDPASASTSGPSDAVLISLLGLILIVGAGLGVMAGRARRNS